jgi:hypothetical protein
MIDDAHGTGAWEGEGLNISVLKCRHIIQMGLVKAVCFGALLQVEGINRGLITKQGFHFSTSSLVAEACKAIDIVELNQGA